MILLKGGTFVTLNNDIYLRVFLIQQAEGGHFYVIR